MNSTGGRISFAVAQGMVALLRQGVHRQSLLKLSQRTVDVTAAGDLLILQGTEEQSQSSKRCITSLRARGVRHVSYLTDVGYFDIVLLVVPVLVQLKSDVSSIRRPSHIKHTQCH